jgi:hypothetical protein
MDALWDRVVDAHEQSVRGHEVAAELFARHASAERSAIAAERAMAASARFARVAALRPVSGDGLHRGHGGADGHRRRVAAGAQ